VIADSFDTVGGRWEIIVRFIDHYRWADTDGEFPTLTTDERDIDVQFFL